eukprot:4028361-Pleurochrysis_carterae.AAC.1
MRCAALSKLQLRLAFQEAPSIATAPRVKDSDQHLFKKVAASPSTPFLLIACFCTDWLRFVSSLACLRKTASPA